MIFGNALSGLAETLVERGARLVHVYDENPARVAEATARCTLTQLSFAPLGPGGIAARDGAFDVGFIDEISQFATASNVVTRLRRALTARGVAFVSTVNPDKKLMYSLAPEGVNPLELTQPSSDKPLSYYDLYDLVTSEFDEVRMVGQTPFVGYALADFSPETDVEFSIDTALVPGGAEEPEFFIAVCSHFPITTESFCVVQMAAETLLGPLFSAPSRDRAGSGAAKSDALDVANKAVSPDAQRLHNQLTETQRLLSSEREARTKAEQLLASVNLELQHRDAWVAELEKRSTAADERADAAEVALGRLETRLKQQPTRVEDPHAQSRQAELSRQVAALTQTRRTLETELAQATESLSNANARVLGLESELQALNSQLEAARTERSQLQSQLSSAASLETKLTTLTERHATTQADLQLALADLARAEGQLSSQGQDIRRLRAELVDTERFAAVLLAQREAARSSVAVDHLGNQGATCTETSRAEMTSTEATSPALEGSLVTTAEPVGTPDSAVEPSTQETEQATPPSAESTQPSPRGSDDVQYEATLQALRWTIEELEQRLEAKSQEEVLLARLHAAQQQLQRQAVLLRQYESQAHDASPSGQ